ncbi:MAG TPA: hypothetical protein VIX12_07170 [Candidatus Binataceae bacterium]
MLERAVEEYESVRTWRRDLSEQWGGDPIAEEPEKLRAVQRFCEFTGEDPDTIVGRCFRIRKSDGERVISAKWRTYYAQKIKEFRDRNGDVDPQRLAADVLSFLIHNGVMVQV